VCGHASRGADPGDGVVCEYPRVSNPQVFRPVSGLVTTGLVILMCVTITYQTWEVGTARQVLVTGAWCFLVSFCAYLVFARPKVTIFDEGITITNPLIDVTAGWQDVDEVEARYCMLIETEGRKVYAWAAPAPGRYHSRHVHREDLRGFNVREGQMMRAGESPRTHSGVATYLARQRLEDFRRRGAQGSISPQRRLNIPGAAVLLLSLASVVALQL
jgi:hypothetical protein